ncbi:MAG: cobalt ECF transporter T component CbiQ, partial [Oscillibacter sp.]|nr:cobalt ECF transporter T component CbiQ [Oscillibacter sp.]
ACGLRCPGERGVPVSLWGALAGQMLLRAMDRGERVYGSMTLRGFHGEYPPPQRRLARGGTLWCILWAAGLAILRAVPVFELVGRLL